MAKCTHVLRTHKLAIHKRAWQHSVFKIVQEPRWMQVTTAKLCCSDVFFRTFVWSPTIFRVSNDGAPSHRAKSTAEFLQRTMPNFIEPSVWAPNSPDLNPVDYVVWGALRQSVYCIPISNLDDLKDRAHLEESWPTDHLQVHWSVAWQTEGSCSSEWWTHWTVVLNTLSA